MAAGHHSARSLRRGPAAIQQSITHTLRRRKKSDEQDYSAVNPFVKYILFVINWSCLLIGAALAALGIYVLHQKDKVVTRFIDFIFDPACLLTLAGCIVLVIAFFGSFGALRESICFLKIYYFVLGFFLLLEIVLVIFIFVFFFVDGAFEKIGLYPEDAFMDAVRKYPSPDDPNPDTDVKNFIDSFQKLLSCCGTSNDDEGYLNWNDNPYYNCSDGNKSLGRCDVPLACCKVSESQITNYRCGNKMLDPDTTDRSSIYTKGCLKRIQEIMTDNNNIWIVGGTITGTLIVQIALITLARALVAQIQEQMSKW